MTRALLCVVLAGCAPRYFVASVHNTTHGIVVEKCAFSFNGRPTDDCHDELINNGLSLTPDPAESQRLKRQLDAPVAPRPVPTDATVSHAVTSNEVHKLVELCRTTYAPSVTTLAISLTVAPSGEITDLSTDAPQGPFAECTSRALRTANIPSYDGTPMHFEQSLTL